MITQSLLKIFLNYNPDTGVFTWITKPSIGVKVGDKAGYVLNNGYRMIQLCGHQILEHRAAWLYVTGVLPDEIDHVNCDRQDNRFSNLRICERHQNVWNTSIRSDNTSGAKGVTWNKQSKKWRARASKNGKRVNLGEFHNFEDAVKARDKFTADNYNSDFYRKV